MKASASAVLALGMLFSTGSPCNAQNFNRRFDLLDNGQTQTGFDIEVLPDSSYAVVLTSAEEDSLAPNLYFSYYSIGLMGIDQSGAKTFQQRYVYPMRGIFAGWSNCCDTL